MGLSGKPYQRSGGGPFSRGGGGGGSGNGGGRGGGRNGANNRNGGGGGGGGGKAGRDSNRGANNNNGGNNNRGGGRGGGGGGRGGNNNNSNNNGGRNGGGPRQQGADVVGALLNMLFEKHFATLYNAESGVLNLASFHQAPDLAAVQSAIDFNNVAFCRSLVNAIKNSPIGVPRFINLSANNITSANNFLRALSDEGMSNGIIAISLSHNKIKDVGFAGVLTRFNNLTELSLQGNPISDPHYRRTLERRIPTLAFLDGDSVKRPPLGLPYPKHSALTGEAQNVLMFLEQALFSALAGGNAQVLMGTYHPDAIFAFSTERQFTISCAIKEGTDKCVRDDLAKLKHSLQDNDANLLARGAVNRVVKGRTQILAALETTMYHKKFMTHHQLIGDANVSFIGNGSAPVPIAVATVHGKMMWLPRAAPEETPRAALFDRTIVMVNDNGSWQITNDAVVLRRPIIDEPLFFADNASRINHLCKEFNSIYPPEVFAAMVALSANDKEYYGLRDAIPKEIIEQCYLLADRNALNCVRIAKLALMRQCAPQDAFNALAAVNFDMGAIQ